MNEQMNRSNCIPALVEETQVGNSHQMNVVNSKQDEQENFSGYNVLIRLPSQGLSSTK